MTTPLPYQPPIPPPGAVNNLSAWHMWATRLVDVVRGVLDGKLNAQGAFTLAVNADSTIITDARISPTSVILLMPLTASAALAGGGTYVGNQTAGQATVMHANDSSTDRMFRFLIIG